MPRSRWPVPAERVRLDRDEVHVWSVALDLEPTSLRTLEDTLAPAERRRATRFIRERDRAHFIAARGFLRAILASYLDLRPDAIRFRYGARGKPFLQDPRGSAALRFSVSHSHGLALYATARERDVGVDLERIRDDVEGGQIVERFFSPREVAAFRALPDEVKSEAFFHCWTRKEAYLKATGEGVSRPLDQFDVSVDPREPTPLLRTAWDPGEATRWSLRSLDPAPEYAAALAVEGQGWSLRCWRWLAGGTAASGGGC